MKTAIKSALTAGLRRIAYYAALFQLYSLETMLAGKCEVLPYITDLQCRADTALSIKQLSLQVVEARNRVRALQPVRNIKSWRLA